MIVNSEHFDDCNWLYFYCHYLWLEFVFVSGLGLKQLTFLDLSLQTKFFGNVDDGTRAVELPSSFNIGRSTYHTLYVRTLV